jgi:hypothetical protein
MFSVLIFLILGEQKAVTESDAGSKAKAIYLPQA